MNFPNIPKPPSIDTPRINTRGGIATIAGVHGADSEGLVYHDTVEYDIRILDANGQSSAIESVKPTNKWWPGMVVKVVPAPIGSEWPCRITTRRLLLWVCETPAVGGCDGNDPGGGTPQTPETPPDDTDIGPPGILGGSPLRPVRSVSPLMRFLATATEGELASLYTVTRAAAMARGLA